LLDNGAELDEEWKPCTYKEALDKISKEREERNKSRERQVKGEKE